MFRNLLSVVGVMALVLGLAGIATAGVVEIITEDGTGADADVLFSVPGQNSGTANNMVVYWVSGSDSRKAYLRFDLGSLDVDTVTAATFEWTYAYSGTGAAIPDGGVTFTVYGLNDSVEEDDWGESTINWSNAPANDNNQNLPDSDATQLGMFTIPVGTPLGTNFTFDTNLLDFIQEDTDGLVTLIVTASTSGNYRFGFAAKEYDKDYLENVDAGNGNVIKPKLTLTTLDTPVSEPASLGLLGLALLGLRKRRS